VIVVVDSSLIAQDTSLGTAVISADTIYIQPIIHFDTTNYVVGEVIQGDTVVVIFNFMNKGTDNLEITDVLPDCSCTSPEYTAGTIQPGESGLIKVVYDSKEDIGGFLKTVTVLHNSGEGYTFLELRGFVSPKL
jgi:hypothetical protein